MSQKIFFSNQLFSKEEPIRMQTRLNDSRKLVKLFIHIQFRLCDFVVFFIDFAFTIAGNMERSCSVVSA